MRRHLAAIAVAALTAVACQTGDGDDARRAEPSPTAAAATDASATTTAPDGATFANIPELVREVEPAVVAVLRQGGEGSGVIFDPDGLVVTNAHVVRGATDLAVQLADGSRVPAEVVAADRLSDLAVLRVDEDGLPAATFADRPPEVGELAVAMGNPLGLNNTVTAGIVSGLNRTLPAGGQQGGPTNVLVDLIQTDAAISPGSSGGALVAADGTVLGVNVAFASPAAGAVSIGFAIPSMTVTSIVEELLADGEVEHAFLGVQLAPVTPQIAEQFDLGVGEGALVVDVVEGGPAAEAGLESGAVITAVDGEPITAFTELIAALRGHDPGDVVTLTVVEGGEERQVEVELGERPSA